MCQPWGCSSSRIRHGESRLTAVIPMDNPCCGCKLTLSGARRRSGKRAVGRAHIRRRGCTFEPSRVGQCDAIEKRLPHPARGVMHLAHILTAAVGISHRDCSCRTHVMAQPTSTFEPAIHLVPCTPSRVGQRVAIGMATGRSATTRLEDSRRGRRGARRCRGRPLSHCTAVS